MQVFDRLEQDFREIYPDEEPVIEGGFEEAMKDLIIPKWNQIDNKIIVIKIE